RPEGSALGVRLKKRHSALLVTHLESPNFSPRALIGAFSGTTGRIGLVLTGPKNIVTGSAWSCQKNMQMDRIRKVRMRLDD
ncbi:MAG: hypothetical protein AB2777_19620, partial [Candidatus Thiodiazotropha endolucinida]